MRSWRCPNDYDGASCDGLGGPGGAGTRLTGDIPGIPGGFTLQVKIGTGGKSAMEYSPWGGPGGPAGLQVRLFRRSSVRPESTAGSP